MKAFEAQGRLNWLLLLTLTGVCGLGLYNLASAARGVESNLALWQGAWFGGCLVVALVLNWIDYRLFERLAYPLFLISLLALLAVLGFGKVVNNSRRWLDLGFINLQPSELMKLGIIVAIAKYFSDDAYTSRVRSTISKIIIRAHPLYPFGAVGALFWMWSSPSLLELGGWRYGLIGLCIIWLPIAVLHSLSLGRSDSVSKDKSSPTADVSYTLDDLIKPATPLYPLGAAFGVILFWEQDPFAALGSWRFVALGSCFIWAAVSVLFAFRTGRTSLHDLLSPVILVAVPAVLIMRQPDLGTALVLSVTAASMVLFMKVRLSSFLIASAVLVVAAVAAWSLVLKPYQQDRIKAFIAPSEDVKDTGYHAQQSIIAVGSGRLRGKGFGNSTQTRFQFLPEQQTDFVFSVWAEEQGFLGCSVVLALFLFLLVQLVNVASGARDRFGVLLCVGMASSLFWHVFINIGMVIGVLPVVGLTLPLWSYGRSSLLAFMLGFGLVLSVSYHKKSR
jgi:cell division protein FtsW (lipid II flippase)